MFEGLWRSYERVEIGLSIEDLTVTTGSVGTTNYSVDGEMVFWRAIEPGSALETEVLANGTLENSLWVKNIRLALLSTQDGDSWEVEWRDQPPVGPESYFHMTGSGAGPIVIEIDDYKVYNRYDGTWRVRLGEARLYVGGVLEHTFSPITLDSLSAAFPKVIPCSLQFPMGKGSAYVAQNPSVSEAAGAGWSYSTSASVTAKISARWQITEDGVTYAHPVSWPAITLPSGNSVSTATVSGTTTWDSVLSLSASDVLDDQWCSPGPGSAQSNPYRHATAKAGEFWLVPIYNRNVVRMLTPSQSLVERGGFPRVFRRGERSHYLSPNFFPEIPGPGEELGTVSVSESEVLPEHTAFLEVVGDSAGIIEDPLSTTLYSPVSLAGSDWQGAELGLDYPWGGSLPAACSIPDWRTGRQYRSDSASFRWPSSVQTRTGGALGANTAIRTNLSHTEPMARLLLTWYCPHWSYALKFPANTIDTNADDIPDQQDEWQVFGSPVEAEYWLDSRQQWMAFTGLGSSPETRNIILSESLSNDRRIAMWQDYLFGFKTSPFGISNFIAQSPTVPASLTMDSSSASLVTGLVNCSVAAGSSIVATPAAAGDIEVAIDASSFTLKPFLFGSLAKEFKFNWSTTNVSALNVYAEGWDGTRVLIYASADKDTWKEWPLSGTAVKFAGSWAQDFGRGYVTDDGVDIDSGGISATTMSDVLRSHVFGLLPGRTCRRFVFVVTPTAVSNVTINWPSFRQTSPKFVPEIAQQGAFIVENGPGVRWGNGAWWNRSLDSFSNPPILQGPETMPTILDGLCGRRVQFDGVAGTDGLDTEIAALFESGIEYTNVRKHMAVDPTDGGQSTHCFWTNGSGGPVLCLVSSMRESPPMSSYPSRTRDTNWQLTNGHNQSVYICHARNRDYTSAAGSIRLVDGADEWPEPVLTGVVPSWKRREHHHAVTNDESLFDIVRISTVLARLRPWHGSFAILSADDSAETHVSSIHLPWGGFVLGWSDGEGLRIARWDYPVPYGEPDSTYRFITKDPEDLQPRFRIDLNLCRLFVTWQRAFSQMEAFSDDDGATWSTPEEIRTDIRWQDTWHDERGFEGRAYFAYDSGASGPGKIWVEVRPPGESAFGSAVVVGGGTPVSFADSTFKIVASPDEQASWILSAIKNGGAVPTHFRSFDDGETWTEI